MVKAIVRALTRQFEDEKLEESFKVHRRSSARNGFHVILGINAFGLTMAFKDIFGERSDMTEDHEARLNCLISIVTTLFALKLLSLLTDVVYDLISPFLLIFLMWQSAVVNAKVRPSSIDPSYYICLIYSICYLWLIPSPWYLSTICFIVGQVVYSESMRPTFSEELFEIHEICYQQGIFINTLTAFFIERRLRQEFLLKEETARIRSRSLKSVVKDLPGPSIVKSTDSKEVKFLNPPAQELFCDTSEEELNVKARRIECGCLFEESITEDNGEEETTVAEIFAEHQQHLERCK